MPGVVGAPLNIFGFQQPFEGQGYCGLQCFSSPSEPEGFKEIAGVRLLEPLQVGQEYWVSFAVSWTSGSPNPDAQTRYANNNLGIQLKGDSLVGDIGWFPWNNTAQLRSTQVITDSSEWTVVSGSFIASESWSYLYLGNFFSDVNTEYVIMDPNATIEGSYYYFDEVCLSPTPAYCPLPMGVNQSDHKGSVTATYNNSTNSIIIAGINNALNVELYDVTGRLIFATRTVANTEGLRISLDDVSSVPMVILRVKGGSVDYRNKFTIQP